VAIGGAGRINQYTRPHPFKFNLAILIKTLSILSF
jgi:hypothetical protein